MWLSDPAATGLRRPDRVHYVIDSADDMVHIFFSYVEKGIKSVLDLFHKSILGAVNRAKWEPATLSSTSQQQCSERLRGIYGGEWVTAAIAAAEAKPDPARIVPLPARFAMRPQRLFA